jgi:lipoprotein-releasing system permease protein
MRPVPGYIGLRYLRSQRSNQFASFVTLASAIGVALGVAALIVVLSVMNGFENELRARLTSMTGHAWVSAPGGIADWQRVRSDLQAWPGIAAVVPVVEVEAVLARGAELSGAVITGIDPRLEAGSPLDSGMLRGSLADLVSGRRGVILGAALAARLGLQVGDAVSVLVPFKQPGVGLQSRLRQYTVTGIFELGVKDHDGSRALVEISEAAALGGMPGRVAGLRVSATDIFAAPALIRAWREAWTARGDDSVSVRDWTEDHATYFRAVRLEKIMMMVLLSLIVGVAAFNIVATLVMVVTDKRGSIAILRTLGFSRATIVGIFAVQGTVIGWIGVIAGVGLGVAVARDVGAVATRLERLFGFEFMPADVYYLTSLPAELHWQDVAGVGAIALVLTAVATIYPAMRAAAVAPAEVLRYE